MRTWMIRSAIAVTIALLCATAVSAQTGTVTGTVTDVETLQPLVGAQVNVPGSGFGTLTNREGRFVLVLPVGEAWIKMHLMRGAQHFYGAFIHKFSNEDHIALR